MDKNSLARALCRLCDIASVSSCDMASVSHRDIAEQI